MPNTIKKIVPLLLLLILSIPTYYRLLRPGIFSMQDDMHIFRLQQFDKCLKDNQIPCRYIPDGGLGYGYPLYNYYSPLPYFVGEIFHLIGFSYIDSIKYVFIIIRLIVPIGFYLFSRHFLSPKPSFLAAILYTYAPYQALDTYVRGAIAESLAIALIPFALHSCFVYITKKRKKYFFTFSVTLTSIFLSHNLYSVVFLVILPLFVLIKYRTPRHLKSVLIPEIISILLAAFFLFPAILESNLVYVETMTQNYFHYSNHFATIYELFFSRFWGYGASLWGPKDDMSFQIGIIHWSLATISTVIILLSNKLKNNTQFVFIYILGIFFTFLTHNRSTIIWKTIPIMPFFQFPWRFLGFVIIFFSIASANILELKPFKTKTGLFIILTLLVIVLNSAYFHEDIWYKNLTDDQKLTGANLITQQSAGLKDYWPKSASTFPDKPAPYLPWTDSSSERFEIYSYSKKSNRLDLSVNVDSQEIVLNLPLVNFPNWITMVDKQKIKPMVDPLLGYVKIPLKYGKHQISMQLTNTPIRTISNTISLVSFALLIVYLLRHEQPN